MFRKYRKLMKNDRAVSPVIAVILMVAITVVLAATVYVWVSGFSGGQGAAAKTISLASNGVEDSSFERTFTVASATSGMKWQDVTFTVDGTALTFVTTAPTDGQIRAGGEAADATVNAGDQITIDLAASGQGATLRVLDSQANSVIYTLSMG